MYQVNFRKKLYTTIKTGVSISINEENNDIYSYLVASVLDYFLSQNGKNQKLELRGNIYCVCEYEIDKKVTITAILSQLLCKYYDIVNSILINHNLGERSEQLITNLRNQISNQQIGNDLDYYINYSSIQCENVLKKTLNKK